MLFFPVRLPKHTVRRNRSSQQSDGCTQAGKVKTHLRHERAQQHHSPVWVREQRGNQVGDEGQTQDAKEHDDRLKAVVDGEIPQEGCHWNDEPDPREARDQVESAANRDQVACDQRDIGNDQHQRSEKGDPEAIILPQDVSQPLLSHTAYFRASELDRLIHRRREQHQPEVAIACPRSIYRIGSQCRCIIACHPRQKAWTQETKQLMKFASCCCREPTRCFCWCHHWPARPLCLHNLRLLHPISLLAYTGASALDMLTSKTCEEANIEPRAVDQVLRSRHCRLDRLLVFRLSNQDELP